MSNAKLRHFKIICWNPKVEAESLAGGCQTCDRYEDAPVCTDGNRDVQCSGERYRGCYPGEYDCADFPGGDDKCCWGHGPGGGDNIDHARCYEHDADWGSTCFVFDPPLMV